jgi:hypothetical protein
MNIQKRRAMDMIYNSLKLSELRLSTAGTLVRSQNQAARCYYYCSSYSFLPILSNYCNVV